MGRLASEFHMDVRALRPGLAADGKSYRHLVDEMCSTLAAGLLRDRATTVCQVAPRRGQPWLHGCTRSRSTRMPVSSTRGTRSCFISGVRLVPRVDDREGGRAVCRCHVAAIPGCGLSPERHVPALTPMERDVAAVGQPRRRPDRWAGSGSREVVSSGRLSSSGCRRSVTLRRFRAAGYRRNVTFLRFSRWNVTLRRCRYR